MAGMESINEDANAEAIAHKLYDDLDLEYVLLTRSERGMTLYDGKQSHHIPTAARDVFDVTGAGDTVIAVFTACLAPGDEYPDSGSGGQPGCRCCGWQSRHGHSRLA